MLTLQSSSSSDGRRFARAAVVALVVALAGQRVHATTLVPLSFEQLVDRAETVFEGEVVDRRVEVRRLPEGDVPFTLVTFSVTRALKGAPQPLVLLQFLGGTSGGRTLRVAGMPQFEVGDRDVLFVHETGQPISPIVGFIWGRFPIGVDRRTGEQVVLSFDLRPFASTAAIGQPPVVASAQPIRPVSLTSFEDSILRRVQGGGR